jgi:hypothetical protein
MRKAPKNLRLSWRMPGHHRKLFAPTLVLTFRGATARAGCRTGNLESARRNHQRRDRVLFGTHCG